LLWFDFVFRNINQQYATEDNHQRQDLYSGYCFASHALVSSFVKLKFHDSPLQMRTAKLNNPAIINCNAAFTNTELPVGWYLDFAFACGYNSIEHFATAYRQKFKINRSRFRKEMVQGGKSV
jgi:AraC-like DNA-binding protein